MTMPNPEIDNYCPPPSTHEDKWSMMQTIERLEKENLRLKDKVKEAIYCLNELGNHSKLNYPLIKHTLHYLRL